MTLAADFDFAHANAAELPTGAAVLRYVAALNLDLVTITDFMAAAANAGYNPATAGKRWREVAKDFTRAA